MTAPDDRMFGRIHARSLLSGGVAPQQENKTFAIFTSIAIVALSFRENLNDGISELFPPTPGMAVGLAVADCQDRVEQQYTLGSPMG